MRKLTSTKNLSHDKWLEYRNKGIGGSDAAAIAGMNPWKSPIRVYLEKIGEVEQPEENERMRIGRDLEDYVAQRFAAGMGMKVRKRNAILQHDEHDWMLANIDRELVGVNEGLECKVTNSYAASDWKYEVPPMYEIQCHHYMAVTGWSACWIAALIGNQEIVIHKIERDQEVIDYLVKIESDFWNNHVLKNEMPPPDGSEDAAELIKKRYSQSVDIEIDLDHAYGEKIARIKEIDALATELNTEKEKLKQEIQLEMGEAEKAFAGEYQVRWKAVKSNRIDSKLLKKEQPEIAEKYSKESVSRRFEVK